MINLPISIPIPIQNSTLNSRYGENFSTWLKNLISPTTATIGEEETLIASISFVEYVKATKFDFIKNHSNFRKYPKISDNDWK